VRRRPRPDAPFDRAAARDKDKRRKAEQLLSLAEDAVARVEERDPFLDAASALDCELSEAEMRVVTTR
jgi:hypothetical protein